MLRQRPARHDPRRSPTRLRHRAGSSSSRATGAVAWPVVARRTAAVDRSASNDSGLDVTDRPRRTPSVYPVCSDPARYALRDAAARSRPRDPPRGLACRPCSSSRSPRRRIVAASSIVFPKPEDTAYYVGVARNLLEGRGLVERRAVELPDAAARVPAPGVRGLAAAADVPRRDPDGGRSARPSPRPRSASVVVGAIVPGPRLAARRRRRGGARPAAGPRPRRWPIGHGPDGGRLPAARSSTRPCPTRRCRSRSSRSAPAC